MPRIVVDLQEKTRNYYALYLSIRKKLSVTQSLIKMGIKTSTVSKSKKKYKYSNMTEDDMEKVIRLKSEGKTRKELGEMNDVSAGTLHNRIKRYMGEDWDNRPWK